jgi:hypothetical protein
LRVDRQFWFEAAKFAPETLDPAQAGMAIEADDAL